MTATSQTEVATALGGRNATDNAAQGVATPAESRQTSPVDKELVISLALKHSATKKGGARFKSAILADKVRAEVRSRLGLEKGQPIPGEVNTLLCGVCELICEHWNKQLAAQGFTQERASGIRPRIKGKEGEETLDLVVSVTHSKALTWKEQANAARLELASLRDKIDKHERGLLPNGKPDMRESEAREFALLNLQVRAERFQAVISRAEAEIASIAQLAKANL